MIDDDDPPKLKSPAVWTCWHKPLPTTTGAFTYCTFRYRRPLMKTITVSPTDSALLWGPRRTKTFREPRHLFRRVPNTEHYNAPFRPTGRSQRRGKKARRQSRGVWPLSTCNEALLELATWKLIRLIFWRNILFHLPNPLWQ
jgi:hypothetical protein